MVHLKSPTPAKLLNFLVPCKSSGHVMSRALNHLRRCVRSRGLPVRHKGEIQPVMMQKGFNISAWETSLLEKTAELAGVTHVKMRAQ